MLIEKAADRMLSLVAPKITAGAGCPCNGPVTLSCYGGACRNGHHWVHVCKVRCNCSIISCGTCFILNKC